MVVKMQNANKKTRSGSQSFGLGPKVQFGGQIVKVPSRADI